MTAPRVTWVLCGGATHAATPRDAIRLSLGDKTASLSVNIDGLGDQLSGRISPDFEDLVRIGAFVLGADGAVSRGPLEDVTDKRWRRHFRFIVDVANPAFWSRRDVTARLCEVLGFLSQDTFEFEFQPRHPRTGNAPKQLTFTNQDGKSFVRWDDIEEVSLFSGGLDSFAGGVDLILRQRRKVILVTHRSSTKVWHAQKELVRGLRDLAKAEEAPDLVHVDLELVRHDERLDAERTQRSRSFLYAAMAGAVADLTGRDRVLMHENGVIGINLPIAGSVVGARATRTAHPRALVGFSTLLSLVAKRPFRVDNPFVLKTRTEIIAALAESPAVHLAKHTLSCVHAHMGSGEHPQCGTCPQCIDRQIGFVAAGMEEHDDILGYGVRLATDTWLEAPRQLLLDWIAAADRFAACPDLSAFIESFGEATRAFHDIAAMLGVAVDQAAQQVFNLHKRHGAAVAHALATLHARYADQIRRGTLKADSLLMLLFRQGIEKQAVVSAPPDSTAENHFLRRHGAWRVRFRSGTPFELVEPHGLHWLSHLLTNPGRVFTTAALIALSQGRDPSRCTKLDPVAKAEVLRLRKTLAAEHEDAREFDDAVGAARCATELQHLDALLTSTETEPPADDRASRALQTQVREAVAKLGKFSSPLLSHLEQHLHVGRVLRYGAPSTVWHTDEPPPTVESVHGAPTVHEVHQLLGWAEILPAIGRVNTKKNRLLVIELNKTTNGPIKARGTRGVIAKQSALLTWWGSVHERFEALQKTKGAAEKRQKATDSWLSNPGVRKELGLHKKERPNTRKRQRD